jgi:hypothetical protein
MRRQIWLALLAIGLGIIGSTSRAAASSVADLQWLEGRWSGVKDGTTSEEHWTSPAGGALVGMHKDVKAGKMTEFEFLRIESAKDGGIVYLASPQGRAVTPFPLAEMAEKRVVFENKAHDFPTRVLYWLDPEGALHARIEGTLQGKPAHEEWVWTKGR